MSLNSTFVKTNTAGSITLADGTGTPVTITLAYDRGDVSVSGLQEVLNEYAVIERRGRYVNVAHAARKYPTISFSAWLPAWQDSGTAPGCLQAFLLRTASSAYASNVSTSGAGSKVPYTIDFTLAIEGTDFGDSADHTFTAADCLLTDYGFSEAAEGMSASITLQVLGAFSGDISAAEYSP